MKTLQTKVNILTLLGRMAKILQKRKFQKNKCEFSQNCLANQ
ncbi:unnamed protein product [Paramecium sonneborni]|uniref:Uncharacterized protein n=1 Tax=Paramecium sonneborni TaxID=65129 RepID=A0A8S1RTA7_9CILI|nr:unnamed protein product [Paramecium sonneborni]